VTSNEQIWAYNRALDFLQGMNVPKDLEKSFALNAKAANAGYREAILAVGWYYLGGVGVERDLEKAKKWYRKSARYGESKAMFSLGRIALIERDFKDALTWFNRAVSAGHARSLYYIGSQYWHGQGVPQDKKEAMKFFQLAAKKKVKEALRVLKFFSRNKSFKTAVEPIA
jgi:uncharacterized protein